MPWDQNDTTIRLFDGTRFDVLRPDPAAISVKAIAIGLSKLVRFGGQLPPDTFYSVAEHSIRVANMLPQHLKRYGLLHDAAEGLGLGDIVSPVKRQLPEAVLIESQLLAAVATRFGLEPSLFTSPAVKSADADMTATEHRWLRYGDWTGPGVAAAENPFSSEGALDHARARERFLAYAHNLGVL